MTTSEIVKTSFLVAIWVFAVQVMAGLLYVAARRTLQQFIAHREVKKGQTRCSGVFHCHCEKRNGHVGEKHVNETNMVVW